MTPDPLLPRAEDALGKVPRDAWTVDRVGRMIAGAFVLGSMLLALCGPLPVWIGCAAGAFVGVQLIVTALIGWCPLQTCLRRLGLKEREEVYVASMRTARSSTSG